MAGTDRASLNEAIVEADVAKRAFYHSLPSKEASLEALAERFARRRGRAPERLAREVTSNKVETAAVNWAIFGAI